VFDGITFAFRLGRLQRSKRQIKAAFAQELKRARSKKEPQDKLDQISHNEMFETDYVSDEIAALHSDRLLQQADYLDIPVPDFEPGDGLTWDRSDMTGRYYLSHDARHKLRSLVDAANKSRREALIWWVPIIFGLIGAITGLASVFKSGH
jgi:hypothetical protein